MISGEISNGDTITVPKHIGCYTTKRVIDTGGTAVVVKARSDLSGERVALKIMDPSSKRPTASVMNVEQEVKIVSRLSHRNIVCTHDVIKENGLVVIAMEYCPETFLDWLERVNHPSNLTLMCAFCQIARAVQYLHAMGIAHGDLKLDNILIDKSDVPKLTDFGFACTEQFKSGEKGGTLIYASPELVTCDRTDMLAADVWALGIVLYAIITRRFPYAPVNDRRLPYLITRGLLNYSRVKDNSIRSLILRMTHLDPVKRATIDEVVAEAERLMHNLGNSLNTP
jgi:serine/threonine protein kinase